VNEQRRPCKLEAPADSCSPARLEDHKPTDPAEQSWNDDAPRPQLPPLVRTAAGCFLACFDKPMALIDSTGKQQGIKFSIKRPEWQMPSQHGPARRCFLFLRAEPGCRGRRLAARNRGTGLAPALPPDPIGLR